MAPTHRFELQPSGELKRVEVNYGGAPLPAANPNPMPAAQPEKQPRAEPEPEPERRLRVNPTPAQLVSGHIFEDDDRRELYERRRELIETTLQRQEDERSRREMIEDIQKAEAPPDVPMNIDVGTLVYITKWKHYGCEQRLIIPQMAVNPSTNVFGIWTSTPCDFHVEVTAGCNYRLCSYDGHPGFTLVFDLPLEEHWHRYSMETLMVEFLIHCDSTADMALALGHK